MRHFVEILWPLVTVITGGSGEGGEGAVTAERVPLLDALAAVGARLRRTQALVVGCTQPSK